MTFTITFTMIIIVEQSLHMSCHLLGSGTWHDSTCFEDMWAVTWRVTGHVETCFPRRAARPERGGSGGGQKLRRHKKASIKWSLRRQDWRNAGTLRGTKSVKDHKIRNASKRHHQHIIFYILSQNRKKKGRSKTLLGVLKFNLSKSKKKIDVSM